mgnify:CR=1 FL=1
MNFIVGNKDWYIKHMTKSINEFIDDSNDRLAAERRNAFHKLKLTKSNNLKYIYIWKEYYQLKGLYIYIVRSISKLTDRRKLVNDKLSKYPYSV